jgi:hypothetical protein
VYYKAATLVVAPLMVSGGPCCVLLSVPLFTCLCSAVRPTLLLGEVYWSQPIHALLGCGSVSDYGRGTPSAAHPGRDRTTFGLGQHSALSTGAGDQGCLPVSVSGQCGGGASCMIVSTSQVLDYSSFIGVALPFDGPVDLLRKGV